MRWTPFLLAALFLAGCSGRAVTTTTDDGGPPLQATPTTGVIRGLVVDAAIRPLPHVHVALPGAATANRTVETDDKGRFGFDRVPPGGHFVTFTKLGYASQQQFVVVQAGDSAPPLTKAILQIVPGASPYVQSFKFNGFLECALSVIALCAAFNGPACPDACTPNVTNDDFSGTVPIDQPPQLIQSEMVWQTTSSASDQLWLWHSRNLIKDNSYNGSCNCWAQGPSPLLMVTNATVARQEDYGTQNNVDLRVFTGSVSGTRDPLNPEGCYPGPPVGDVYCGGVGYSIEQSFTIYTHVFYGYLPPDGWRFSSGADVPPPPT